MTEKTTENEEAVLTNSTEEAAETQLQTTIGTEDSITPLTELLTAGITETGNEINKMAEGTVVEKTGIPKALKDTASRFTELDNMTSQIRYQNSFSNTDLEYVLSSGQVKENIVVKSEQEKYIYDFEMKLDGLIPVYNEDGSITLYQEVYKQEELVLEAIFIIPAPYMYDAREEYSDAVRYELNKITENTYVLRVVADTEWINAEERQFPVTIDPAINSMGNTVNNAYVKSGQSGNIQGNFLQVGTSSTGEAYRTYIKTNIPVLQSGDVVSNAVLSLNQYNLLLFQNTSNIQIDLHPVYDSWDLNSLSWINQPNICGKVDFVTEKYNHIGNHGAILEFDVTSTIRNWYGGNTPNNGFRLSSAYEGEDGNYAIFRSGRANVGLPSLIVYYTNRKGIEDYWSFSSAGMGSAGTALVNNYTGNLLVSRTDLAMKGDLMPINVSFTFDTTMKNKNFTENNAYTKEYNLYTGYSWKMNLQQTVKPVPNELSAVTPYRYVYADADGTEHYFVEIGSAPNKKMVDESGSGYELTIENSEYIITDKSQNRLEFESSGYLKRIKDNSNNTLTIFYNTGSGLVGRISYVTDGYGRRTDFRYNSYNYLKEI